MTHRRLETRGGPVPYRIVNRPRVTRRLHLELDEEGGLLVVVPRDWPDFYTRRLLRSNLAFVERFLRRSRQRRLAPLVYGDGGRHLFRGSELVLRLHPGQGRGVGTRLEEGTLHLAMGDPDPERVKAALRRWYLDQARRLFQARLDAGRRRAEWADRRDLQLRFRRMRRTWGTCSGKGVIRMNTHLVKAPLAVLDYVISHELCHLQEMNHGPRFYALQERLWPRWRAFRAHLNEHGHRYTQE